MSRFHDPRVGFHLQFEHDPDMSEPPMADNAETPEPEAVQATGSDSAADGAQVVSLDSFRKK